jgi:hypothetical protein
MLGQLRVRILAQSAPQRAARRRRGRRWHATRKTAAVAGKPRCGLPACPKRSARCSARGIQCHGSPCNPESPWRVRPLWRYRAGWLLQRRRSGRGECGCRCKFNNHWRLHASVKTSEMLWMKDSYVDLSAWQALSILAGWSSSHIGNDHQFSRGQAGFLKFDDGRNRF